MELTVNDFVRANGRNPHHGYEFQEWVDNCLFDAGIVNENLEEQISEKTIEDHVNPSHYKLIPKEAYERFPNGLEYMDLMTYLLSHHEPLAAHCIGQSFKYLVRAGKKDLLIQDLKKAEWYLAYLINHLSKDA